VAVVSLISAAWTVVVGLGAPVPHRSVGLARAAARTPKFLQQSAGVLGSLDVPLPRPLYALWGLAALALVALALVTAQRRHRWVVAGLAVFALALPVMADGFSLPPIGFDWQGRYGLPLDIGVVIVAAAVTRMGRRWIARPAAVAVGLLGAGQVAAFSAAGRRYGLGTKSGGDPLRYLWEARWNPPVPPVVLALGAVAGAVAMVVALCAPGAAVEVQ
jgi:hypothetical protein